MARQIVTGGDSRQTILRRVNIVEHPGQTVRLKAG